MAYRKSLEQPCPICLAARNMLAKPMPKRNRLYTKKITYTPELYVEADALFHAKQNKPKSQKPQLVAMHMFADTTLLTGKKNYAKI
jgi:hypothetical protein